MTRYAVRATNLPPRFRVLKNLLNFNFGIVISFGLLYNISIKLNIMGNFVYLQGYPFESERYIYAFFKRFGH